MLMVRNLAMPHRSIGPPACVCGCLVGELALADIGSGRTSKSVCLAGKLANHLRVHLGAARRELRLAGLSLAS